MESAFCEPVPEGTCLIETFGWTPVGGFQRLERHLARMARSAAVFGFDFDEAAARAAIRVSGNAALRCRLTLGREGFAFTSAVMAPIAGRWRVAIAPQRVSAGDPWLRHKTTQRALYDQARAGLPDAIDEWLFLNERGALCEGTITNLFVTLADGRMLTPPVACGLLPGILRESLIAAGAVEEQVIDMDVLRAARQIHMGNSLRGLIPAQLVA